MNLEEDFIEIDLSDVKSKQEFYEKLCLKLNFPEYFGNNLDALYDVLTDVHPFWKIKLQSCERLRQNLGKEFYDSIKEVFEDAVEDGAALEVLFE